MCALLRRIEVTSFQVYATELCFIWGGDKRRQAGGHRAHLIQRRRSQSGHDRGHTVRSIKVCHLMQALDFRTDKIMTCTAVRMYVDHAGDHRLACGIHHACVGLGRHITNGCDHTVANQNIALIKASVFTVPYVCVFNNHNISSHFKNKISKHRYTYYIIAKKTPLYKRNMQNIPLFLQFLQQKKQERHCFVLSCSWCFIFLARGEAKRSAPHRYTRG